VRITLIALGTRGDVTPCVALGIRLQAQGHAVRVATFGEFESLVRRHALEYHRVSGSYSSFLATNEGRTALGVPSARPTGIAAVLAPFQGCAGVVFDQCWEACDDAEVIGASTVGAAPALWIACARNVPFVSCQAVPSIATRELPHNCFPAWPLGKRYNRLTHTLGRYLAARGNRAVLTAWQESARRMSPGVESRWRSPGLSLIAASPVLVPRPTDWPASAHVTGFWFLPKESAGEVPAELRAFVEDGPPPICLGFGSMGDNDPYELRGIVVDALRRLGMRAVIVGGSGGALRGFEDSKTVRSVSYVDYEWLFPRMAAVVHQGGAGTAAFCLTAGVPQACVPYCLDHRFWSWRLEVLGVAPPPITRHRLTGRGLAELIRRAVGDRRLRARAEQVAPVVRSENGAERAAELVTRFVDARVRPHRRLPAYR
jgi:UDP:flavonoid glycosyltransferase YjiC (YdhE family)